MSKSAYHAAQVASLKNTIHGLQQEKEDITHQHRRQADTISSLLEGWSRGARGDQGTPGAQGITGAPGKKGDKGDKGDAAHYDLVFANRDLQQRLAEQTIVLREVRARSNQQVGMLGDRWATIERLEERNDRQYKLLNAETTHISWYQQYARGLGKIIQDLRKQINDLEIRSEQQANLELRNNNQLKIIQDLRKQINDLEIRSEQQANLELRNNNQLKIIQDLRKRINDLELRDKNQDYTIGWYRQETYRLNKALFDTKATGVGSTPSGVFNAPPSTSRT